MGKGLGVKGNLARKLRWLKCRMAQVSRNQTPPGLSDYGIQRTLKSNEKVYSTGVTWLDLSFWIVPWLQYGE